MKKISILFLGLLATVTIGNAQITDPGWFQVDNQIPEAEAAGVTNQYHTSHFSGQGMNSLSLDFVPVSPIAEAVTPQIQALADGLQHDPQQLFNYVHDQIRFVLYFGSKKGAQLTLLEKSGNDFDQCALLMALLQASGYTNAQYQFGWQQIPYDDPDQAGYDLRNWWQLTFDNTNWTDTISYIGQLAGTRGYPKIYYVTGSSNFFDIQRMWIALTTKGTTYNLDPAFKISGKFSGISLTNAMGSGAISNALSSTAGGTDTGSSTSGLNEANLRSKLTGYATNLVNYIQSNAPTASVPEILGGWQIVPADSVADLSTTTTFDVVNPNGHLPLISWSYQPTNLMSTLTVGFAGTNHQWFIPQLQGQRLALTFDASASAQLWLDDSNIITKSIGAGNGSTDVALSVTHPVGSWDTANNLFIPNPTNSANQVTTNSYQSTNANYALIYAFEPDWGWVQQRQNQLGVYFQQGLAEGSRQVVSENLNVMGLNWMLQTAKAEQMIADQLGMLPQHYHRLGRMAQEAGKGYYVDVYMQLTGAFPNGGDAATQARNRNIHFDLNSFFASALEHGIIEQFQNTNLVAASTVKMLQIANTNGQAIYLASSTNWSAINGSLVNYTTATKNSIYTNIISRGYYVLMPGNGSNHVSAAAGSWAGYGLQARRSANGVAAEVQMLIAGGYQGGFVSDPTAETSFYYNLFVAQNQADAFTSVPLSTPALTGADPVDLANGTFLVENLDFSLGQSEPHGISLTRSYNGTRRASNPAGMAGGWLHNYYLTAANVAAPQAGLGETTPAQAAPMMAAIASAIAYYNAGFPNPKNWVVTSLISKWGVDQIIKNGVTVNLGKDVVQFIKQPDGTFTPPPNCTMTLTQGGSGYSLEMRHGNTFNFNAAGLATSIVDQYGQGMSLTYNASNWVSTIVDWKNIHFIFNYSGTPARLASVTDGIRTVSYGYSTNYNPQGDLVSFTDAEGGTTTYLYDTNHQITATVDAQSRLVVSNVYDGQGHIAWQFTEGDTNKAWRIYWAEGKTVTVDPAGGETDYNYDEKGRLVSVVDPIGHTTVNSYDGQNHIIETVFPDGTSSQYAYDADNNLVTSIDPLGFTNQFFYDSNDNLIRSVDPRGNASTFGYNNHFLLKGATNGAGDWVNYTYNVTNGLMLTRTDAAGTTSYDYDGLGQLNTVIHPGGLGQEYWGNDDWGNVTNHTDARGFVTMFAYDDCRRLTLTTAPTNLTVKVNYDAVGNVASTRDGRGFWTTNTWSATRHLVKTTLPATLAGVAVVSNAYDARDLLVRTINPQLSTINYSNDAAGRVLAVTDPVQRTTKFSYDANGRNLAAVNAANRTNSQTWDARGGLLRQTDGAGRFSTRTYDAAGNQIALTNRNGKVWRFAFDGANRLTNTVTPLGRSSSVAFNNRGLLASAKDAAGQTTTLSYDAKGRLTNRTDSVGSTIYSYNANDKRNRVVENGQTNVWTNNAYGWTSSYRDGNGNLIRYKYDANGNVTNLIYPSGKTVTYFYNALNQLTNVTDWSGRKTVFAYDLAGQMTSLTRPNGSYRTVSYDAAGQATNILEQMANTLPIALFKYNWGNSGSMAWEFAAPLPHTASIPTRTMTYDDDNRLLTVNSVNVGSDANGNLTNAPLITSNFVSYAYDARNRLKNAGGVTNTYDTLNNRIGITSGTNTTAFVVNPNAALPQVLMRIKNGVTNYYIYGVGLLYEITETATATNTRTYHYDYRGSTIALSIDSGLVTDRIEYSAYGLTTYRTGTSDTPFLFNGRYGVQTDSNGLLYMRARFYNPYLCRFISADPSGFGGGLNSYAYANGNPISLIDPFGLNAHSTADTFFTWVDKGFDATLDAIDLQVTQYQGLVNSLDTQTAWKQPLNYASSAVMLGVMDMVGILDWAGVTPDSLMAIPMMAPEGRSLRAIEEETMPLYRVVTDAELASIKASGKFSVLPGSSTPLPGVQGKWFYQSLADAQNWAAKAAEIDGGPLTIIQTTVPKTLQPIYTGAPWVDGIRNPGLFFDLKSLTAPITPAIH